MPRLLYTATKPIQESETDAEGQPQQSTQAANTLEDPINKNISSTEAEEEKEAQVTNNAAAIQHIHIISSDEEENVLAAQSTASGQLGGFAGFPSPGSNLLNVTPNLSRDSLRKRASKESTNGAELGKRTSFGSRVSGNINMELEQVTPVKRKREPGEVGVGDEPPPVGNSNNIPNNLHIPLPDQIVEVNSNSTTHSQRQQRLQRRCAQQHTLQQNTRCSTETSSEFPVSSPSNPQPGCSKFQQRPPLLKNTLPADSFERQLAMVTAHNPQMTLADKMRAWQCETDISDVEDVNEFDALFQSSEDRKRKTIKSVKNKMAEQEYDFHHFRYVILKNLKSQTQMTQQRSERDKPSTSAAAAASQQRRQEKKTRPLKEPQLQQKKKTQSSTTPAPASSTATTSASSHASSDYLVAGALYSRVKRSPCQSNSPKLQIYEQVLCPSSSSEHSKAAEFLSRKPSETSAVDKTSATAATTTIATPNSQSAKISLKAKDSVADTVASVALSTTPLNLHWTSAEEDSVFRLNRLNREIDKDKLKTKNVNNKPNSEPKRLIQMHLDFQADKKDLNLRERKGEIFKTPFVPSTKSSSHQQQVQEQQFVHTSNNNSMNSNADAVSTNQSLPSQSGGSGVYEASKSCRDFAGSTLSSPSRSHSPHAQQNSQDQQLEHPEQHEGLHQQHEFCSYLGLTGMSTANAVASAVAELARSNIARRSLRVRRQQHELDKHDKNDKEQRQLEALKMKQLREIKRRDRPLKGVADENDKQLEGMESMADSLTYQAMQAMASKNVLLSNIQALAHAVPPSSATTAKDCTRKEPEIKILCHIAADDKDEVQKISQKYVKQITDPIRDELIRHIKEGNSTTGCTSLTGGHSTLGGIEVKPIEADLKTNEADANITNKAKAVTPTPILLSPTSTIVSPSPETPTPVKPILATPTIVIPTQVKPTSILRSSSRMQLKQEQQSSQCKIASSTEDTSVRGFVTDSEVKVEELMQADTQQKLHMKFQEYLEASRRAKPSIFIVQSIDNEKEKKKRILFAEVLDGDSNADKGTAYVKEVREVDNGEEKVTTKEDDKSGPRLSGGTVVGDVLPKRKSKRRLGKLLTRSVLNMTQQRQLRNRKIVILKTIKRKTLTSRSKDKKFKKSKTSIGVENEKVASKNVKVDENKSLCLRRKHVAILQPKTSTEDGGETSHYLTVLFEPTKGVLKKPKELTKPNEQNELVVVSSTTNCYDEHAATKECSNNTIECIASRRTFVLDDTTVFTKDIAIQCVPEPEKLSTDHICQLTPPSSPLKNPLNTANGKALHIYFELDILIVVQDILLSFWKYSKLLNVLNIQSHLQHCKQQTNQQREVESTSPTLDSLGEWLHLGECKRLLHDMEIHAPFANRICIHNSIPIYIEMRCKELQKERRDCNLLSLYINIYYYNDEDMHAKMHSIQLDAVQSFPVNVIYTTITDSRYFVMSWPQENILGKIRSGLCKYSLTPHLDTLASIREFKSMRHEILYLECTEDDKLIGFGATQLTIWDHRSGDVLMNYDLDIKLGRNLGSIYYPSLEIGQNSMILLFQFLPAPQESAEHSKLPSHSAINVIACSISHVTPSHRVLYRHVLPSPNFTQVTNAINTGEHMLLRAPNDEEIWISCADPKMMTLLPAQDTQRFYVRGRSQIIILTERTLTVDCFANYVLKIAAESSY